MCVNSFSTPKPQQTFSVHIENDKMFFFHKMTITDGGIAITIVLKPLKRVQPVLDKTVFKQFLISFLAVSDV